MHVVEAGPLKKFPGVVAWGKQHPRRDSGGTFESVVGTNVASCSLVLSAVCNGGRRWNPTSRRRRYLPCGCPVGDVRVRGGWVLYRFQPEGGRAGFVQVVERGLRALVFIRGRVARGADRDAARGLPSRSHAATSRSVPSTGGPGRAADFFPLIESPSVVAPWDGHLNSLLASGGVKVVPPARRRITPDLPHVLHDGVGGDGLHAHVAAATIQSMQASRCGCV